MFRKLSSNNFIILLSIFFGSMLCYSRGHDDDKIIFDGPVNYGNRDPHSSPRTMTLEEQIRMAMQINQIETIEDFINGLEDVPEDVIVTETSILSRFGGSGTGRSNAEVPKAATCAPELQPVSLTNSTPSSNLFYFPSCTRVPRCGGCCLHPSLSCQPTDSITRNFQVVVAELNVNEGRTYKRKEIIPIEEHTKCLCSCRIKSHHCNERQTYSKENCRCSCSNVDEEIKCLRNNETKLWDDDKCVCLCRGNTECTSGSYFDHNTCSCKKMIGGRRPNGVGRGGTDGNRYYQVNNNSGKVPPTYTIGANDPRRRHREDPE